MRESFVWHPNGPTTCQAHPLVMRNIRQQVAENRVLSMADARIAVAAGLITAHPVSRVGFNDGVIYPPDESVNRAIALGASPSRAAARSAPSGTLHALALLVDFSDNPGTRPAQEFERLLFDPANTGSMTSFYRDLSYGALTVTGEVHGYIRAPHPYTFYTDGQSGTGRNFPRNTPGLLHDVLQIFCQSNTLQRFDNDADGFVDGIFLIHAGPGAEAERDPAKRPHMIWSHKWVLPTPFVHEGVRVFAYSTEPEDGRLGVFAHEFGHVLGLPDLYDTTYRSGGVGTWCLMGGGSWGGQGNRPTRLCCWTLAQLGWITPTAVQANGRVVLPPIADDASACRRLWASGTPGPEYFLLEHRRNRGRDQSLPGSGLALWHVDERQADNTNPLAYRVAIVQADGQRDIEYNRNSGDAGDLFPGAGGVRRIDDGTTPSLRANGGTATGLVLSAIAVNTKGNVTVNVRLRAGTSPAVGAPEARKTRRAAKGGARRRSVKVAARTRRVRVTKRRTVSGRSARSTR